MYTEHRLSRACIMLRPKDLTHEVLEHWEIRFRQVPRLHYLCPSACNLRFPQALRDERREQDSAHGIRVINLPSDQRSNRLRCDK